MNPDTRTGLRWATLLLGLAPLAAAAQSSDSVTLYGRIDLNLTRFSGGPTEVTQSSTSRFGLRGSEALGAGWSAIFQLEARINPDNGTSETPRFFGRQSWVGLRGSPGTFRLGRTLTPAQRIASDFDPHDTDGIGTFGASGILLGQSALPRFDNGLYYETPKLAGWSLYTGVQLDETRDGVDDRIASTRLRYESGPIDVALGYADLSEGNEVKSLAAAYKFGAFKPMAQYHWGERAGRERRTYLVGLLADVGPGDLRASYSKADDRFSTNIDRTLVAVGYDLPLSKRTLVYGTVARDRTTGQRSRSGIELGLRHSF